MGPTPPLACPTHIDSKRVVYVANQRKRKQFLETVYLGTIIYLVPGARFYLVSLTNYEVIHLKGFRKETMLSRWMLTPRPDLECPEK